MTVLALVLLLAPLFFLVYAYIGYPLLLRILASWRPGTPPAAGPERWPMISITVPCYNEEASIAATLESLLALDYPADRRQILVVSDASTDRTEEIVRGFASRGVELLAMPERKGKTAIENAAGRVVRGDIVVNIDATIRVRPKSLKALIAAFQDPTVGVASGRDVSVGAEEAEGNTAESGYVGYEMWVRSLETRLGSIVGASGCFYGFRREIHDTSFPEALSRDFACALIAREHGLRAVSVDDAVCVVPRAPALRAEFRRKIRTMARGLETLWFKRHLMNPFRYGGFAVMLISHKLCRWLVYLLLPTALLGLVVLSIAHPIARVLLGVTIVGIAMGTIGMRWPANRRVPRVFALPGFLLASNLAGFMAWVNVLRGERNVLWEPTRRAA
jgi:cellulose synthase/poly-beta-1,6-N-acetylglucosamine synthase-like glycosyltransferase